MEAIRNAADHLSCAVYGFYRNLYKSEPDPDLQAEREAIFAATDTGLAVAESWRSPSADGEVGVSDHTERQITEEATRISKDVQEGKINNEDDLVQEIRRLSRLGSDGGDDYEDAKFQDSDDAKFQDPDDEKGGSDDDALFSEDQEEWVRDLYHGLERQFSQYTCQYSHLARLRLPLSNARGRDPSFEVFFSNHQDEWGWIRSGCTLLSHLEEQEILGCEFIRNAIHNNTSLDLFVKRATEIGPHQPEQTPHATGKGTVQLRTPASPNERMRGKARPVVSLRDLLKPNPKSVQVTSKSRKLSPLLKERLCWNLVLGLLHLGKDGWKSIPWHTSESGIFFLRDPTNGEIRDKANPYLSWTFEQRSKSTINGDQRTDNQESLEFHLLGFARLLLKVYMWTDLEFSTSMNILDCQLDLLRLVQNNLGVDASRVKAAIEGCLNDAAQKAAQSQDLHNYVRENIVLKMREYRNTSHMSEEVPPPSSDTVFLFDHVEDLCSQYPNRGKANDFFEHMDSYLRDNICGSPNQTSVKVAIIDSGIDLPLLRKVRRPVHEIVYDIEAKVKCRRNFCAGPIDDCADNVGHGTKTAWLLHQVAPEAELYIAKVCDSFEIPSREACHIAEAIYWAVTEWKVDIISLSIGLRCKDDAIDRALRLLSMHRDRSLEVITFAASGNGGGNSQCAWPARRLGIVSVSATDGHGSAARFNQRTLGQPASDFPSLATLGIDIPWSYVDNTNQLKHSLISGSSYATPIAAGIAANVLEFTRRRTHFERTVHLHSCVGMTKVLQAMSFEISGFKYFQPWTFWEEAKSGNLNPKYGLENISCDGDENVSAVLEVILS